MNRPSMDRYTGVLGDSAVLKAGELAALVGVEDLRPAVSGQRLAHRLDAKPGVHGVLESRQART